MALAEKYVKHVPWFSLTEWHDVYKQVYSNDTIEQTKAYETLLLWKARIPKLPVGVDATLSILQVCLRDREWTSMIDKQELPVCYEEDLSLMYSTTIMRFLNHISAIGHTKKTSLFQIAKQLKIPVSIVELRHNAAHGNELVSLENLRIAINILLVWLHDEYWAAEACMMEEYYTKKVDKLEEETQAIKDLIELWTSVSLYIHAGHQLISDISDTQLQETLQDLQTHVLSQHSRDSDEDEYVVKVNKNNINSDKKYNLTAAQALLLSEISLYLTRYETTLKKSSKICDILCQNETFLPGTEIMQIFLQKEKVKKKFKKKLLPPDMLQFWKDIIILLHKKKLLGTLILKLFDIVDKEEESNEKRTLASLWISSIIYSFIQLDIAQSICRTIEYNLKKRGMKLLTKDLNRRVKKNVHSSHPYLQNVVWLDISSTIPGFLFDINFLSKLLLYVNEFSAESVQLILQLIPTHKMDTQTKKHISTLLKIYTSQKHNDDNDENKVYEKIYTVDDLEASVTKKKEQIFTKKHIKKETTCFLSDRVTRNLHWKLAPDTYQWIRYPIGLLPWQDSLKRLEPLKSITKVKYSLPDPDSQIVAGIVNIKNLKMKSHINWDNVLRKKRKLKRKSNENVAIVIMNRALETAKKYK